MPLVQRSRAGTTVLVRWDALREGAMEGQIGVGEGLGTRKESTYAFLLVPQRST